MSLDEKGELIGGFDIINWIVFPNKSFSRVKIGKMDPQMPRGKELTINDMAISWHSSFNQVRPDQRSGYSKNG